MRTDEDIEILPTENLAADPLISKVHRQRAGAERGPRTVDPGTDAEHRPAPQVWAPSDAAEVGARDASQGEPGRYSDAVFAEKPTKVETPYRSRVFVSHRHSADGNSYGVGEPIPEVEAERQATMVFGEVFAREAVTIVTAPQATPSGVDVVAPETVAVHDDSDETYLPPTTGERITTTPVDVEVKCTKCQGYGKSPKMVRRHGTEIGHCPMCGPCTRCDGTGREPTEEVST